MSDIRGEMTSVHPSASVAGSWYVSDLPPPDDNPYSSS